MNVKLVVFFGVIFFLTKSASSQYRITIDSSNTFSNDLKYGEGLSFLIEIPFNYEIKSLYINNEKGIIPVQMLFNERNSRWFRFDTLRISEKKNNRKVVIKRKNTHQYDLCEYVLLKGNHIDTLDGVDDRLSKYKELLTGTKISLDSVKVYYVEEYGSSCCPEDPIYTIKPALDDFIRDFETNHNVKIKGTYVENLGKEGERRVYFTFDGLTNLLKIEFMNERRYSLLLHKEVKDYVVGNIIYMPFVIAKKGLLPTTK